MKIRSYIILVFSLIILSFLSYKISAEKVGEDIQLPKPNLEYNLHKDIIYKNTDGNNPLKLDIYQPKKITKEKSPVIIYIHGGAWVAGNKDVILDNFRGYVLEELLNNQYTVISINYTLLNNKTHIDKTLQDCNDLLKWIKENADQYKLDLNNLGIWGGSSGAHIAMLTAYNKDKEALENPEYPKLKYVVSYYGPTDLNLLFQTNANPVVLEIFKLSSPEKFKIRHQKLQELTGFDIYKKKNEVIKKCNELSPINYVNKNTIPTLIFHGTSDSIVDISQSQLLADALKRNKIYHQYFVLDNAKHTFSNISKEEAKDVAKKTVDFINSLDKKTSNVD